MRKIRDYGLLCLDIAAFAWSIVVLAVELIIVGKTVVALKKWKTGNDDRYKPDNIH